MEGLDVKDLIKRAVDKGLECYQAGKTVEAEMVLNQLLKVDPENIEALEIMGLVMHRAKRYSEGVEYFKKVLAIDDNRSTTHNNLGLCYGGTGNVDLAIQEINRALELSPDNSCFIVNIALQYKDKDDKENCMKYFDKAIEANPNDNNMWASLGSTYGHMKDYRKAIECYDKSIEINPSFASAIVDKGHAYAFLGEWEKAWPLLHHRLEYFEPVAQFRKIYDFNKYWNGKDSLENKRFVVWCEQGIGDWINFSRFFKPLRERGCRVLLHCPDPLIGFFEFNKIADEIKGSFTNNDCDYHCSLMDLPWLLDIKDLELKEFYKNSKNADFSQFADKFKIGIVWAGNPRNPNDQNRSTYLKYFHNIHNIPGVVLISLQKDLRPRAYSNHPKPVDLAEGCLDMTLVNTAPFINDFGDTSALIKELDLVISIDTAVLHMSGILGVKTMGILPYNPDWRWGGEGKTTVWYPTVKLYRQSKRDDWQSAFDEVDKDVKELVNAKNNL